MADPSFSTGFVCPEVGRICQSSTHQVRILSMEAVSEIDPPGAGMARKSASASSHLWRYGNGESGRIRPMFGRNSPSFEPLVRFPTSITLPGKTATGAHANGKKGQTSVRETSDLHPTR